MSRGAGDIRVGARGAPFIRVGAVLDLGVSGGRGVGKRLVMEATPLVRWGMMERILFTCRGRRRGICSS